MKLSFKMDESLSPSLAQILVARDHDVATVTGEGLKGQPDEVVAGVCRREGRCLVTSDADFGQVLAYPPEQYSGIVVLHHPRPTLVGFRAWWSNSQWRSKANRQSASSGSSSRAASESTTQQILRAIPQTPFPRSLGKGARGT